MNKITQACICIACITVVVVCLIVAFRKPASPDMEFLKQWEKAKQEYTQSVTAPLSKQIQELQEEVKKLKEDNSELRSKIIDTNAKSRPLREPNPIGSGEVTDSLFNEDN